MWRQMQVVGGLGDRGFPPRPIGLLAASRAGRAAPRSEWRRAAAKVRAPVCSSGLRGLAAAARSQSSRNAARPRAAARGGERAGAACRHGTESSPQHGGAPVPRHLVSRGGRPLDPPALQRDPGEAQQAREPVPDGLRRSLAHRPSALEHKHSQRPGVNPGSWIPSREWSFNSRGLWGPRDAAGRRAGGSPGRPPRASRRWCSFGDSGRAPSSAR